MAQYFTDFSEYTSDEQPSDWTRQWGTADLFAVRDVTGATGDKVLELAASGQGTSRRTITWDEIDDDPDKADVEIVARARWTTGGDGPGKMNRQMVRVGGSSGSEDAYWGVNDSEVSADTGVLATEKYVNGGFTEMDRVSINRGVVEQDDWFFVRVRVNGTDLKTKMWGGTVDDEPSGWDEERTDNDLSDGGVGVGSFTAEDMEWDWVGVGTDGDTAPTEDTGTTEALSGTLAGTSADSATARPQVAVSGTLAGTSEDTGASRRTVGLAGTLAGTSEDTAVVTTSGKVLLSGTLAGTSADSATARPQVALAGTLAGSSLDSAAPAVTEALTGTLAGTSADTAAISTATIVALSGALAGTSLDTAAARQREGLSGTLVGVSTDTATVSILGAVTAVVFGNPGAEPLVAGDLGAEPLVDGDPGGGPLVEGDLEGEGS